MDVMQTLAVIEVSLDYTTVFTPTPSVSKFRVLGVFCIDRIASWRFLMLQIQALLCNLNLTRSLSPWHIILSNNR